MERMVGDWTFIDPYNFIFQKFQPAKIPVNGDIILKEHPVMFLASVLRVVQVPPAKQLQGKRATTVKRQLASTAHRRIL